MNKTSIELSAKTKAAIDQWTAKFPSDKKPSAVLSALHIVQDENSGWLTTELMDKVADYLAMPKIAVYEVVSFYSMYNLKPIGRHKISVCTNISCMLRKSAAIVGHIQHKLKIKTGETTADGKFTLREVECLGACVNAPMMQVGKRYYENLTAKKVDEILDGLK